MTFFRQLFLLFWKDLLLVRRNIVWLIFELVLPLIILFGFLRLLDVESTKEKTIEIQHNPFEIHGSVEDVFSDQNFANTIYKRWCNRNKVVIGYASNMDNSTDSDLTETMKKMAEKYNDGERFSMKLKRHDSRSELLKALKDDLPPAESQSLCVTRSYVGGVFFDEFNVKTGELKYRILLPRPKIDESYHLDESWNQPYGPVPGSKEFLDRPLEPPYSISGFLTLQHSIETTFIEMIRGSLVESPAVQLMDLPVPAYNQPNLGIFIKLIKVVMGFSQLMMVLHIAREIVQEKVTVKPFLAAMGLSTTTFYLSHVLFAYMKCLIIVIASVVPLINVLTSVSVPAFTLTLLLYSLSSILFGTMVASLLKRINSINTVILVGWILLLVQSYFFSPRPDQITLCFLSCLNLNSAFGLAVSAIDDYMKRERHLHLYNMFDDSTLQFSLGFALSMMLFDVVWMWCATLLFDKILNSADFSLRPCFDKMDFLKEEDENETDSGRNGQSNARLSQVNDISTSEASRFDQTALLEGANEVDGARDTARADIDVNRLVKVWSSTGERAVDGLSLRAVQGQVSVLLGHNGAGKSTTFASIAGMIRPSYGRVMICGHDVVNENTETRKFIGLCPQYNPLYDKLTVSQHLWLIHGLKGAPSETFTSERNRLLEDIKLDFKKNEMAMNLSGGMKRKLCVCMALIGESKVVLLDEPTAGMDPGARKDVQEMIEREKCSRTILLTTHYMDEAERLGDWVFIMSHGRLVASGTTQYLKQKFGTGYLLTVVLEQGEDKQCAKDLLAAICEKTIDKAHLGENHGQQVEIILPETEKSNFVRLFRLLEAVKSRNFASDSLAHLPNSVKGDLAKLNIATFGLSLNSLEQVFITIGDKVDEAMATKKSDRLKRGTSSSNSSGVLKVPSYGTQMSRKSVDSYQRFMDSQTRGTDLRGCSLVLAQARAIVRKKSLFMMRNPFTTISQYAFPLLALALIALLSTMSSNDSEEERNLSLGSFGPARVIWHMAKTSKEAEKFKQIVDSQSQFIVSRYSTTDMTLSNITKNLIGELPVAGLGLEFNSTNPDRMIGLFNRRAYHSLPTLISTLNQARLMTGGSSNGTIESGIVIYVKDTESRKLLSASNINMILAPSLIVVFACLTSPLVVFLIEERVSMFAHQQSLTGISPLTFWGVCFLFDMALYIVACSVFLIIFLIFSWMTEHLAVVVLVWFIYFIATVPFIYAISFMFDSSSKANTLLSLWQIVVSLVTMGIISVLYFLNKETVLQPILLFLFPSFAFGQTLFTIATLGAEYSTWDMFAWNSIGRPVTMMCSFSLFACTVFTAFQFKSIRRAFTKLWTIRRTQSNDVQPIMTDMPHCDKVDQEKELIHNGDTSGHTLVIKDLTKMFGELKALNELCLAVDPKECFGLLGVNGAGKTTTFNVLTGQSFATSGSATIGGKDVNDRISIGYCPQFDALMLDLTGRESLEILAQMHGYSDYEKKAELVLECVGMTAHANKLVRYYSGGQKRKISVGVAILAPSYMIILDEPTAGIDPKARREVWEMLMWVRENSNNSLLLTSHSMDECEALCSRIGVLNKGTLVAIGTSQDLKSLYGNSYTMTLSLRNDSQRENVCQVVADTFPGSQLKTKDTSHTLSLKWIISKGKVDKWSDMFAKVEAIAGQLNMRDFVLAQSSLEETFLRLAGLDKDESHIEEEAESTGRKRRHKNNIGGPAPV